MSAERVLAAVLVQPGRYELQEYALPEPAPGCVLIRMEYQSNQVPALAWHGATI